MRYSVLLLHQCSLGEALGFPHTTNSESWKVCVCFTRTEWERELWVLFHFRQRFYFKEILFVLIAVSTRNSYLYNGFDFWFVICSNFSQEQWNAQLLTNQSWVPGYVSAFWSQGRKSWCSMWTDWESVVRIPSRSNQEVIFSANWSLLVRHTGKMGGFSKLFLDIRHQSQGVHPAEHNVNNQPLAEGWIQQTVQSGSRIAMLLRLFGLFFFLFSNSDCPCALQGLEVSIGTIMIVVCLVLLWILQPQEERHSILW